MDELKEPERLEQLEHTGRIEFSTEPFGEKDLAQLAVALGKVFTEYAPYLA